MGALRLGVAPVPDPDPVPVPEKRLETFTATDLPAF
jgi:hypothetical protein